MTEEAPAAPLERRVPRELTSDSLLEGFLDYVTERGLELYPAQEEAILELVSGRSVILNTPTGSGKSLVASAMCFRALAERRRAFYTAPVKALVNEKFFDACRDFGARNVGLMTGDASVNRDAPIICCTAEILANVALAEMEDARVDYVVMDEFHYYADRERGWAWQVPLLVLPEHTRFLLMSATFGELKAFEGAIEALTGEAPAVVTSDRRPVPLEFTYRETVLQETVEELLKENKAPIYLVHFTQRSAAEQAQTLMSIDFLDKEKKREIQAELVGFRFDTPFGKDLRRWVQHGIGVHHAGMLPKYRLMVEKLAQRGLLKLICGTDTLGVGVNIPIRTVLLTQLCKYDGKKTAILTVRDFKQIVGRAGRKGFDDQGYVVAQAPEHEVENIKLRAKMAADPKKAKKIRMKKPPERGYAHWDERTFHKLIDSPPERLDSSFEVTHSMLLQVLDREDGDGCRRMKKLLRATHEPRAKKFQHGRVALGMFRSLIEADVVEVTKQHGRAFVDVKSDLQTDFSLNHSLSLYVVEAIRALDRESESYAFDAISLVEATLENPTAVLLAQLDKKKGDLVAQLKQEGVEYEDRMRELEQVEIDKPALETILTSYEAFREKHPWLSPGYVQPKSIAREMLEKGMGLTDYVKEYGLSRAEGVLLRYLSGAYKACVQTIPEDEKTDHFYDLCDELGAVVRSVDSSLIEEWEHLLEPSAPPSVDASPEPTSQTRDITQDRRAFTAMVRNLAARLLRLLALGRYEDAADLAGEGWTIKKMDDAMAAYHSEHAALRFDPGARAPANTLVTEEPTRWTVRQIMLDPDALDDWSFTFEVDLEKARAEGQPVMQLLTLEPS
ncbi:MAG: DEAD/DEAH box helicase [Sandaracinaceae bacterium]